MVDVRRWSHGGVVARRTSWFHREAMKTLAAITISARTMAPTRRPLVLRGALLLAFGLGEGGLFLLVFRVPHITVALLARLIGAFVLLDGAMTIVEATLMRERSLWLLPQALTGVAAAGLVLLLPAASALAIFAWWAVVIGLFEAGESLASGPAACSCRSSRWRLACSFSQIAGTSLMYVVNSPTPIISVSPRSLLRGAGWRVVLDDVAGRPQVRRGLGARRDLHDSTDVAAPPCDVRPGLRRDADDGVRRLHAGLPRDDRHDRRRRRLRDRLYVVPMGGQRVFPAATDVWDAGAADPRPHHRHDVRLCQRAGDGVGDGSMGEERLVSPGGLSRRRVLRLGERQCLRRPWAHVEMGELTQMALGGAP